MTRRRRVPALVGAVLLPNLFLLAQLALLGACAFGATQTPSPSLGWLRVLPIATALFNSPIPGYALSFALWTWLARPSRAIDVASVMALRLRRGAAP